MKNISKRSLAMLCAVALLLGLAPLTALAGDAGAVTITADDFIAQVSGKTEQETTIDLTAKVPGLTVTVGADAGWKTGNNTFTTPSGTQYTSYYQGSDNPKPANGTGTYYKIALADTAASGTMELAYMINAKKTVTLLDGDDAIYTSETATVNTPEAHTIFAQSGHTYTLYSPGSKCRIYGFTFEAGDPAEKFAQEIAGLTFDLIKGENASANAVEEDLELVQAYESRFGSCDVSWTSSNPGAVNTDGTVNCQKTAVTVTLTGHFSVQENSDLKADKDFTVTLIADPDDGAAVAAAKAALTLGDTTLVKRDLTLPTVGKRGTAITWTSSDPAVADSQGKVYPMADQDRTAVLTATIRRGDASDTKEFDITVAGMVPVTLDSWLYADAAGEVSLAAVDGGSILSVAITCNDPHPGEDDVMVAAVYNADESRLKAYKVLSVQQVFQDIPVGKSAGVTLDLPMDSTDVFKLLAFDQKTLEPAIDPATPDDSLADGAKIYVVGDSTAAAYTDKYYPRKGWAQMLGNYFDGVEVVDLALSGRSSLSFKSDAEYTTLKNYIKKGDYLIIQFGHNDSKGEDAARYTDPSKDRFSAGSFQSSMLEYVELAWEKGAHPILATSISRRKTSDASLETYVNATRALANALSLPCIDLYGATNSWINEVGLDSAKDMFNYVLACDSRFAGYAGFSGSDYYNGTTDDTHLNLYGADLIAQWAADAMKDLAIPVAAKMSSHRAADPLPSFAEATSVSPASLLDATYSVSGDTEPGAGGGQSTPGSATITTTTDGEGNTLTSYALSTDVTQGKRYLLLEVKGTANGFALNSSSVLYLNQATATADGVSFPAFTTEPTKGASVLLGGQFTSGSSPKLLKTIGVPSDIPLVEMVAEGWQESLYAELSGIRASQVTAVSWTGTMTGSLTGDDLAYLVRDVDDVVRIDIPGLKAGSYDLDVTAGGKHYLALGLEVTAYDRSGFAHFHYTEGVGAYNDDGTLKDNALVLYVTDQNKDTVNISIADDVRDVNVTGIGRILNSNNSKVNLFLLRALARDYTDKYGKEHKSQPLVVRFIGKVTAPEGVSEYKKGSTNGFMADMLSAANVTLEGIGPDASLDGWGISFGADNNDGEEGLARNFEVRNLAFRNVPEDCIGISGRGDSTGAITVPVEHVWVHNCEFYVPKIANPAEDDKGEGDGACDFKFGRYMTLDYNFFSGYHKTGLVGGDDKNQQYHITWHHNYFKGCDQRCPLARQADIHLYNNVYEDTKTNGSSYCVSLRANTYIFSEYNSFIRCKDPVKQDGTGVFKSFNDIFVECTGHNVAAEVSSRDETVESTNPYAGFETDPEGYIAAGAYLLDDNVETAQINTKTHAGVMKAADPGAIVTYAGSTGGLEWECSAGGVITPTAGQVEEGSTVYVASYAENGRFLGISQMAADKAVQLKGALRKATFFWLDSLEQTPKSGKAAVFH